MKSFLPIAALDWPGVLIFIGILVFQMIGAWMKKKNDGEEIPDPQSSPSQQPSTSPRPIEKPSGQQTLEDLMEALGLPSEDPQTAEPVRPPEPVLPRSIPTPPPITLPPPRIPTPLPQPRTEIRSWEEESEIDPKTLLEQEKALLRIALEEDRQVSPRDPRTHPVFFQNRDELQRAILLKEILGPPKTFSI